MIKKLFVAFASVSFVFMAQSGSASALWPHTSFTQDGVPVHMVVEKGYVSNNLVHDERDTYFSVFVAGDQRGNPGAIQVRLTPSGTSDCDLANGPDGGSIYITLFHPGNPGGENHGSCTTRDIWFQKNWDNGYRRYYPDRGVVGQGITEYIVRVHLHLPASYVSTNSKGFAFYAEAPSNPEAGFGVAAGLPISLMADKAQGFFTNMFITQQGPCNAPSGGVVGGKDYDNWGSNDAQDNTAGNWVAMAASFRPIAGADTPVAPAGGVWSHNGANVWRPGSGSGGTDSLSVWTSPMAKYHFVLHSIGRNNFVTLNMPFGGDPYTCIPAPTPATIVPATYVNGGAGNITIDAQNGNAAFHHDLVVPFYDRMDHTVSFVVEQFNSTAYDCSTGGAWQVVGSGSVLVNAVTTHRLYGPANAAFDRNTTRQVCQRLRITDNNGANVAAWSSQLHAVVAGGVITPSATFNPSGIISPGEVIVITPQVAARADGGNAYPMTYTYRITTSVPIAGLPPIVFNSPVNNITAAQSNFSHPTNLTIPSSAPAGSRLCVNVTVTNPTLTRYFTGGTPTTGDLCVIIASKPVFMVNGGDLLAGADVDTGTCTSGSTEGTIGGWNVGGPNYEGASTQLTAFAKFGITGFATAARGTQGVSPPSGLAFANIAKPSGSSYGAAFGRVPCMADQWVPASDASPITTAGIGQLSGSKAYVLPVGDQVIGGFTVQNGVQQVIYVNGNLTINADIKYNRANWNAIGDIPALKFVVTGDITIQNNVSVLDGVYAATGDINTCEQTVSSTYFANCANQLEVNGSLIAKGTVNLKRTYKDLRQASNTLPYEVAEVINYRPEVWLANWPKIDGATSSETGYDGVSSLPPVL